MQGAGIDPRDVLPWNAYPWYINAAPNSAQLRAGVEPLRRLVALLPGLRVILLLGRDAQRGWRYVDATHPHLPEERGITVLPTFHPGRQALWHQARLSARSARSTCASRSSRRDPLWTRGSEHLGLSVVSA